MALHNYITKKIVNVLQKSKEKYKKPCSQKKRARSIFYEII